MSNFLLLNYFEYQIFCHDPTNPKNLCQFETFWIGKIENFVIFCVTACPSLTVDIKTPSVIISLTFM